MDEIHVVGKNLSAKRFFSRSNYPGHTTKRLPLGRDCVGGVLARAAGARLGELPAAAAIGRVVQPLRYDRTGGFLQRGKSRQRRRQLPQP